MKFDPTKKFKRRGGVEARLRYVGSTKKYHVFENPEGELDSYYLDGRCHEAHESPDDLVNIPEEKWRPFKDDSEFAPHRDGWFRLNGSADERLSVTSYNQTHVRIGFTWFCWADLHKNCVFDDGTPCGVKEAVQ